MRATDAGSPRSFARVRELFDSTDLTPSSRWGLYAVARYASWAAAQFARTHCPRQARISAIASRLEALHHLGMGIQDVVRMFLPDFQRPIIPIERAAKENSVGAREHVTGADVAIVDLRLR